MRLGKYFPETKWYSTYSVIIEGCLCAIELVRPLVIINQLPALDDSESFDRTLWGTILEVCLNWPCYHLWQSSICLMFQKCLCQNNQRCS